jgi:hypothetical protein
MRISRAPRTVILSICGLSDKLYAPLRGRDGVAKGRSNGQTGKQMSLCAVSKRYCGPAGQVKKQANLVACSVVVFLVDRRVALTW